MGHVSDLAERVNRAVNRAKAVTLVSVGLLAVTAVVGGAAVALTHADGTPQPVAETTAPPTPARSITPGPPAPASSFHSNRTHASDTNSNQSGESVASATTASLKVPPVHKLTPPDAIVTVPNSVSSHSLRWLRRQSGVHRVAAADSGRISIHGVRLRALGVPLRVRGFTPSLTANSTPLWQSIARGELTIAYANSRHLRHNLGQTFTARGPHHHQSPLRIGAFATIGLDGTQALLSRPAAAAAGLHHGRAALVIAPKLSLDTLTADLRKAFGGKAHLHITRAPVINQSVESTIAEQRIPATYLDLYRRAAVTCPGLPWTVLAAIGTVETGNGANVHRSSAGALGPMQFMPSTWAMYGYDANGDGKANIHDPTDSIFSAARYLCAAGAGLGGQSLDNAIFAYNHAWWYVREVINIANSYA
jgi:hypothetical protein